MKIELEDWQVKQLREYFGYNHSTQLSHWAYNVFNKAHKKQLILNSSCELSKEKSKTVIVGFENYIAKVHPDPDSVLIDNMERWKQIVLLAENYANQ